MGEMTHLGIAGLPYRAFWNQCRRQFAKHLGGQWGDLLWVRVIGVMTDHRPFFLRPWTTARIGGLHGQDVMGRAMILKRVTLSGHCTYNIGGSMDR